MQLWSQSWAKAQMWTRASGFSEGPQKLCSPGLLSCRVSFQSPFSPGACHIFPGTRCRSRLVCVVARGLSPPAGKAIAGLRCGPWKGHSFYSPEVCLLKALPPAGGANLLLRLASVLETRFQSLYWT